MINTLISAINERREVSFTYSGISRIVRPVAIGESRKGNVVLRCYQIKGGHIRPGHEWDLCLIDNISSLQITNDFFVVDPLGYKKGDKQMCKIFTEL
jgi:predicted DNA-binding transcriptional regulator YafY